MKAALSSPLQAAPQHCADLPEVNKWHLLQDIVLGRLALGLKAQEIAVLEVLLSFIPGKTIGAREKLVVYPANSTICTRLNGMPCSTMRRHLSRLVSLGLIARRDSPNGKRYQRSYGEEVVAYGFDLSPLWQRMGEIRSHAEAARRAEAEIHALREAIALQRRDLIALLAADEPCDALTDLSRALRRKLSGTDLQGISEKLQQLIHAYTPLEIAVETKDLSSSGAQSEQQYQNTNIYHSESVEQICDQLPCKAKGSKVLRTEEVPLALVLSTCNKLSNLSPEPIQCWYSLQRAVEALYPMMGISPVVWFSAKARLGCDKAAAIVAAILERFETIRSPNAYLESLCIRSVSGLLRFPAIFEALARRNLSSQL